MVNSVVATAALAFGAGVSAIGSAHVVNKCSYDVFLCETPASGGGFSVIEKTLASGDDWEQEYTALSNGAGWSIKLSKDDGAFGSDVLQYEYTYQNDEMIWFDMSCVDGCPDIPWEFTADADTCNPHQNYYRFWNDDANGMQSCNSDASVTVTLCPDSDASASAPGYSSASSKSTVAPVYSSAVASPTTFATLTTKAPSYNGGAVIVTEIVTEIATATQYAKRHQHHRGAHEHA